MIHKSSLRCQKIVQALLGFARRSAPERKAVCLNSLVEAALEILQYQLRTSNVEAILKLEPHLPQTMVDPHQMQQVLVNLINNARQAIEAHQPKGWIRLTTVANGETVRVIIQDSGPGIAEENLSKIFDPFFTTKEVGKGTGLGLSLCYGIIKEHGGTITPRSRPGEGATFIIELPVTDAPREVVEETAPSEADTTHVREGAGKKVLVIDDEESILQMVREALTPRGYEVDIASDGASGLQRMSQKEYDVALCDWKMPGLNGQQVYERARALNPALSSRMIFITGDVINERTQKFLEQQNKICLPKPFTIAEFRTAIKKVLAGS
jgi:two-component system NtrC family sensor kinase